MSKTYIEINVQMTPEQVEGARTNLMEIHPEMIDQIQEMSMEELVKLAWLDVVSMSGFPAENVEVKRGTYDQKK